MMRAEIERLMSQRPILVEEVWAAIKKAARLGDPEDLSLIVQLANMDNIVDDVIIALPALASLPAWRLSGLEALRKILEGWELHGADAQRLLLSIAAGDDLSTVHLFFVPPGWFADCRIVIDEEMRHRAGQIIRELMLNQLTDVRLREYLIHNLSLDLMMSRETTEPHPTVEYFFEAFTDTRLLLNQPLIDQFQNILNSSPKREEELHKFLFAHPIFLDPLAIEIRSKHELGSEFVTDFVLQRINNEYVLVEIEKSTDKLFTSKGVFHSELTEAVAQVRDFQAWIHDNIAYAREKLPGIRRPEGLVVIGRRQDLELQLAMKLDEENYSRRGHIKVITFDDLLAQARVIYANMLSQPLRIKGKVPIRRA